MVVAEQATEPLASLHPPVLVRRHGPAVQQCMFETLVVPLTVVVGEVLGNGSSEVIFSQRHDSIQTFVLD